MTIFVSDDFVEASSINLTAHTPEVGGAWAKHSGTTANISVGSAGYAEADSPSTTAFYYNDAVPASADFYVEADIEVTASGFVGPGLIARSNGASSYYQVFIGNDGSDIQVANATTVFSTAHLSGQAWKVRLQCEGTSIKVFVDGVERISVTDSAITAAGFAGVRGRQGGRISQFRAATLSSAPPTLGTITTTAVTSNSISFSIPVTY